MRISSGDAVSTNSNEGRKRSLNKAISSSFNGNSEAIKRAEKAGQYDGYSFLRSASLGLPVHFSLSDRIGERVKCVYLHVVGLLQNIALRFWHVVSRHSNGYLSFGLPPLRPMQ